jgi:hypothetical protein
MVVYREGTDPVDITTGLAAVERALGFAAATPRAVVDRLRATGGLALAIEKKPTGDGAHLHVVCSPSARPVSQTLAGMDKIELDDRTIDVSQLGEHRLSIDDAVTERVRWFRADWRQADSNQCRCRTTSRPSASDFPGRCSGPIEPAESPSERRPARHRSPQGVCFRNWWHVLAERTVRGGRDIHESAVD